jgi:exosortase
MSPPFLTKPKRGVESRTPVPWQAGLLPAFAVALWAMAIGQLSAEWRLNEQYHFGWLVPLLALYLMKVRFERPPSPGAAPAARLVWGVSMVLALLAVLALPWHAANPDSRLLDWWFSVLAAGVSLVAFWQAGGGKWVAHFAFPLLFFFIAVPLPARIESPGMQWLMRNNAIIAVEALHWLGISGEARGNLIALPNCTLGVDEACSGIRSLQGTLMLTLFLGELISLSRWRRVVLLGAGFGLAVLTNVGRTIALSLVAVRGGLPAVERWHDTAGYTVLAVCSAAVALTAWWLKPRGAVVTSMASGPVIDFTGMSRRLRLVAPCGAIGLTTLAAGFVLTEAWFRAHEQSNVIMPAWSFRFPTEGQSFRKTEIPARTRTALGFDEGASGQWRDADGRRWQAFYFHWLPQRNSPQDVAGHDPRSCLAAVGMQEIAVLPEIMVDRNGLRLTFDAFHFREGAQDLFVFNCLADDVRRGDGESRIRGDNTLRSRLAATLAGKRRLRNVSQRRLEVAVWGVPDGAAASKAFRELIDSQLEIAEHFLR